MCKFAIILLGVLAGAAFATATPTVSSLTLGASILYGGNSVAATVRLNEAAPTGGTKVTLASNSKDATVPASVEVSATDTAVTFEVSTLGVDAAVTATISASGGGVTKTSTLKINPAILYSLSLSPTVYAGWQPKLEYAFLDGKAGPSGLVLAVGSNSAALSAPASVKVAAQAYSVSLDLTGHPVKLETPVSLTVRNAEVTKTASIEVLPTAQATAKLTWTGTGSTFTYSLSLVNTGTQPIGTFWFASDGEAEKNLLPLEPSAVESPAGWRAEYGHHGASDGYSILWTASKALAPGDTATGFAFTTTASPVTVLGKSIAYPTLPIVNSFVYIDGPSGDPGYLVPISHIALPSYTVNLVGLLAPGTDSIANDLNNAGELVGGAEESPGGVGHAFLWTKTGGLTDLGSFGSTLSASALSVTDGGAVAGEITLNNGGEDYAVPFLIGSGFPEKPGLPPGCDSIVAFGMTNDGKFVVEGQLNQLGTEESFGSYMFSGGKWSDIGESGGPGTTNELFTFDRLTNTAYGSLASQDSTKAIRWKWADGTISEFDWTKIATSITLASYYSGGAKGEWLGTLANGHAGYISADGGTTTDLGFAGSVTGLNSSGQAVGNYSPDGGFHQYGFYWSKLTGFIDLNQLIDPSLGITIVAATHINTSGQIAVQTQNPKVATDYYLGVAGLLTPD